MAYLGTNLSPDDYYRLRAKEYVNPHQDAIKTILGTFAQYILPKVADMGCGSGLVTQILSSEGLNDFVGVDRSLEMVHRYTRETGHIGRVLNFWDELPKANTAVFAHSLHLCPVSRMHDVIWRLRQAGISKIIVTSPLKRAIAGFRLPILEVTRAPSGSDNKTIWGWAFDVP